MNGTCSCRPASRRSAQRSTTSAIIPSSDFVIVTFLFQNFALFPFSLKQFKYFDNSSEGFETIGLECSTILCPPVHVALVPWTDSVLYDVCEQYNIINKNAIALLSSPVILFRLNAVRHLLRAWLLRIAAQLALVMFTQVT